MTRVIMNQYPAVAETINPENINDVKVWLQQMATLHGLRWLLAHAYDGVVWGENRDNVLVTSDSVAPQIVPSLQTATLIQARIFSDAAELLLWRDGHDNWCAVLIRQPREGEEPTFSESIDEQQILWGTDTETLPNNFTLLSDGAQGLRHVVPFVVQGNYDERSRPLRLHLRHYIQEDESGFVRIVASRLVGLMMDGH